MNQHMEQQRIHVSSLIHYPIKGCRGHESTRTFVERMGLKDDRRMMVVTPRGRFLTQREHPRLALVTPQLSAGMLALSAPGCEELHIPIRREGSITPVTVWRSTAIDSIDQGDEAAAWFSDWLGASVRLVRMADGYRRTLNQEYSVTPDDHTGFADGYPILLISEESLCDLNSRLQAPVPMDRFRPNLVVSGCGAFDEDSWKRILVGGIEMAVVKPCARCVVTTIDKQTLEQSQEPLKTLAGYRKHRLGALFGQNVIPLGEGPLEIAMPVEILR